MDKRKIITEEETQWIARTGKRMKDARIQRGIKQKDLAAALGLKTSILSNFENGKKPIRLFTFYKMCAILKKDANTMMGRVRRSTITNINTTHDDV